MTLASLGLSSVSARGHEAGAGAVISVSAPDSRAGLLS